MDPRDSVQVIYPRGKMQRYPSPPVYQPVTTLDEDYFGLQQGWRVIKQRFGLILTITVGVTTAVGVWTFQQQPIYLGQFQLLIKSNGKPTQLDSPDRLPVENTWSDSHTQVEVLKSPRVLNPILKNIAPRYPELDYKALTQEQVRGKQSLQISRLQNTNILEVSYQDEDPQKIFFVLKNLADAYVRHGLETRNARLKQGMEFVATQSRKFNQQINYYQSEIQKLRQKYGLINPENHSQQISQQLATLESQYLETQVRLREATTLYNTLQKQLGTTPESAITTSSLSESPRYQNLLNELQKIEIELAQESAIFLEETPKIQALKEEKANLIELLNQEAKRVTGNNSKGQSPNDFRLTSPSSLRLNLNQQLVQSGNEIEVLKNRIVYIEKQIQELTEQKKEMPAIARRYAELQQNLAVSHQSLGRFLEAQEKIQIEIAQETSPWELISEPELPEKPIYPVPGKNLALGMMAGLMLGLGVAFLVDKLDPSFHSIQELKYLTGLPILGIISRHRNWQKSISNQGILRQKEEKKLAGLNSDSGVKIATKLPRNKPLWFDNSSSFLDAFLSLNSNIRLLATKEPIKSIVISSAMTSEGKSITALHLAQAAALMGQKVLLIEADLRHPRYREWLDLDGQPGLSEVISKEIELDSAISSLLQWDNLSVLTAGDIHSEPLRLLTGERMSELAQELQQSPVYDLIIYDSPPLLDFPDGKILATLAQGMILVTHRGKTERNALKTCLDELTMSNISLLGLVVNCC